MTYSDRHSERERDWIRDERERARGAFDPADTRRLERSYDYQAAERDAERAPRQPYRGGGRDFGPEAYAPYGVTGPTNYDGGYAGDFGHRPGDVGRAYADHNDYRRHGPQDIPRGRHFGDTNAQGADYAPNPREGRGEPVRSWWDRTQDDVQAFFGDEDARRRRQWDDLHMASRPDGEHRGRGPRGYRRSDERIREDVSDRLADDAWLDASSIDVEVKEGEVTLSGTVASRGDKRRAEDLADSCSGVGHLQNNLRVRQSQAPTGMVGDRDTLETGGMAATQATTRTSGRA